jgi:ABC-2 type transport system permease protein
MSPARTIFLIARREFVTRVRTRVFIIGTVLVLVGLAGYLAFQQLVVNKEIAKAESFKVAFVGEAQSLSTPLIASSKVLGFKIEKQTVSDQAQGESQVRNGTLDILVTGAATSPTVLVRDQLNSTVQAALQGIVRQLALDNQLSSAGLNPATVDAKVASATVHVQTLKPQNAERIQLSVAGFIVALFLYVALLTYGAFIAQGVVEEKANRIVEILLSTVRPEQLLIGKVVGIGSVGLLQLLIIGGAALILVTATNVFSVPSAAASVVFAGLLWFILGFFLYAILFAAAGSLVSRQEEVQGAVLPITLMTVIAWLIAIGVLEPMFTGAPMSSTGIILALIPPISPVLMPSGIATGDITPPLAVLGVVLTLLTSAAATWIAARIYANSVLRIGARVSLREALRTRR